MLRVGNVADGFTFKFDSIAGGAVRVVEHGGAHTDFIAEPNCFASFKINERQFCFERLDRHREHGVGHLPRYYLVEAALLFQMPGHERKFVIGMEGGGKEAKACNVIPMGMGKHQSVFFDAFAKIPMAEIADAGAGIKDDLLITGIHFQTARIAAESDMIG